MKNSLEKVVAFCSTGLLVFSITACKNQTLPVPKAEPTKPVLAVSPKNLPKVLSDITETITKADKEKNKDLLATRADGPALQMRATLYLLAEKSDYSIVSFPGGSESTTVSLSKYWPRVIYNVTQSDNKNQKYVEIITQDSPKSGFKLSQWMKLLPGATFPATAASGKGSLLIDSKNSKNLLVSPEAAIKKWPIAITKKDSQEAKLFVKNDFAKELAAEPSQLQEAIKDSEGKVSADLQLSTGKNTSFSIATSNGGSLTTATYKYNFKITDIKQYRPLVFSNALGTLLGDDGKIKSSASWTKTITVLFYIPKSGSKDRVQILAAENIITNATK